MRTRVTLTGQRLFYGTLAVISLALCGALLVAWSGLYNVAASRGHPAWLNWFLEFGMRRSVEVNAKRIETPALDDTGLIALGAAHFRDGCAPCHGAPGDPVNPIYQGMLPVPPKLERHAPAWPPHELHWIVKHGLQYAGMPGWAGAGRDDEVWAMVAFLQALPDMNQTEYRRLTAGNAGLTHPAAEELIKRGGTSSSLLTCSKCHDTASRPPISGMVPRLGGQSKTYLVRALNDYRRNRRQSGFMEPAASEIPEEELEAIAAWFAKLDSPPHDENSLPGADLDAGMTIALRGDPSRRVAACQACHDGQAKAAYPRLADQSADYLEAQLKLWRDSPPSNTGYGDIMAAAIGKITDAQIRDVSAWYASRSAGPDETDGRPQ